jgi:hypothetical protein
VQVGDESVERHTEDFEPEKERYEVGAGSQDHRSKGGYRNQDIELFAVAFPRGQIAVGEQGYHKAGCDDQSHEE